MLVKAPFKEWSKQLKPGSCIIYSVHFHRTFSASHRKLTPPRPKIKAAHQTLRVTPAMESGITSHVWTIEEIAALTKSNL
jgi:hypothetical protein